MHVQYVEKKRCISLTLFLWVTAAFLVCPYSEVAADVDSEADYSQVVLLNNGGTVKGRVSPQSDEKTLVVERRDGQTVKLDRSRVVLIGRAGEYESRQRELLDSITTHQPDRLKPHATARISLVDGRKESLVSLQVLAHKSLTPSIDISAGLGWEAASKAEVYQLPIMAEASWYLTDDALAPVLYATTGYVLGFQEHSHDARLDGFLLSAGFGVLSTFLDKSALSIRFGVRYQDFDDSHPVLNDAHSLAAFSLGLVF